MKRAGVSHNAEVITWKLAVVENCVYIVLFPINVKLGEMTPKQAKEGWVRSWDRQSLDRWEDKHFSDSGKSFSACRWALRCPWRRHSRDLGEVPSPTAPRQLSAGGSFSSSGKHLFSNYVGGSTVSCGELSWDRAAWMAQVPALGEHGGHWHHRRQQDFPPQRSSNVLWSCMAGLWATDPRDLWLLSPLQWETFGHTLPFLFSFKLVCTLECWFCRANTTGPLLWVKFTRFLWTALGTY